MRWLTGPKVLHALVETSALALRVVACACIVLLAITKLGVSSGRLRTMYLPKILARTPYRREILRLVVLSEVALALWLCVAPGKLWLLLMGCAGFVLSVSAYGVAAILHTGDCGCSPISKVSSIRRFAARQSALLGALVAGLGLGPRLGSYVDSDVVYPALAAAPLGAVLALAAGRSVLAFRDSAEVRA